MSAARGLRFTFTPHQGWSTSTQSPAKRNHGATSSCRPPLPTSVNPAALLSISPTIGFESSTTAGLPALVSPRAHVKLTRCTSAPPVTPSPRSKRKRRSTRSRPCSDSSEDERWSYAAASECREAADGASVEAVEEESVDSELYAINSRPLSILVSPVCVRERPHCPIPPSPADSETQSLTSSSSASTASSPRRPLFVNHIVSAEKRRTSPRLNAASIRPATESLSGASSVSSAHCTSMPPLLSSSLSVPSTPSTPLLSPYTARIAVATPSSSCTASSATLSSPPLTAACRTRSQWRRFRLGAVEPSDDAVDTPKRSLPRRIVPTLVQEVQKPIPVLTAAPLPGRSLSIGSVLQHTPPRQSVRIPSSPPQVSRSKKQKVGPAPVGAEVKSRSLTRNWSRGEQTSIHDYLALA